MAMDKSTADCYVYSKASGSLSKSFIGNRKSVLFSQSSIPQLWSLLFSKEIPSIILSISYEIVVNEGKINLSN